MLFAKVQEASRESNDDEDGDQEAEYFRVEV